MKYDLKRPCAQCPFRRDVPPIPMSSPFAARVREMVAAILAGEIPFACHMTNEYDEAGDPVDAGCTQFCTGAIIMMRKMGRTHPDVEAACREGRFSYEQLDMNADVFSTPAEMLEAMEGAAFRRWEPEN